MIDIKGNLVVIGDRVRYFNVNDYDTGIIVGFGFEQNRDVAVIRNVRSKNDKKDRRRFREHFYKV